MWIALGFIQPPNIGGETMKEVGERYFDILVNKSLLDKFQNFYGTCYKLHDLLHKMLRVVSAQEYFSIISDEELLLKGSETTRHLFVKTSNLVVLKKVEEFKNLHSFILVYFGWCEDLVVVLAKIFKTLRNIRLVHIYAPHLKHIPKEIGNLIHLRYLNFLKNSDIQQRGFKENFYHLKFMVYDIFEYHMSEVDNCFPRDINNFYNLLYLRLPFPGMHEIGKISSLQELDRLYVRNRSGYGLEELELMNELCVLKINFHEDLKDAKDAHKAKLCDKRNLIDLSLEWIYDGSNADTGLNENVLDNLQPHSSLKKLKIINYMGFRSAIWMNDVHLISKLEYIELQACFNWQTLPPFWQLPFLKYLYLYRMTKVEGFDYTFHGNDKIRVFPSLQVLHIQELEALENLFVATAAAAHECLFPCLTELYLQDCPNLHELPGLPPKLEILEIHNIKWKGCNWLQGINNYCSISIQNCTNLISLRGHQEMETIETSRLILSELIINDPSMLLTMPLRSTTSIQKLEIHDNDAITSFPTEAGQWFLQVSSSLCELEFSFLESLQCLPFSLESLSSLKILSVKRVSLLRLLPNMPTSLEQLKLEGLKSLQFLPSSLESLSSLKILRLKDFPLLQLLPNMPASIEQLDLEKLESLQSLPSSLESLPSLKILTVEKVLQVQLLPNMPNSLEQLNLKNMESMRSLPSSLESMSSLKILCVEGVPMLQLLPNIPTSLERLELIKLESLQSLPSSLESFSSLKILRVEEVPLFQLLPNMPNSLEKINLKKLESIQSLPSSLESLSSLKILSVEEVPLLQLLPNMPASLEQLELEKLESLQCLTSSLSFSSLKRLCLRSIPFLQKLPDLPPSLTTLIIKNCHPELKKCCQKITGSDWHKIAHIPVVIIN